MPILVCTMAVAANAVSLLSTAAPPLTPHPSPLTPHDWTSPIGRMDTSVIKECSGIDKSERYEGIYWTHNDSGNPAEIFAVKLDGQLVARFPVIGAPNLDWEDIAVDGGFIYVADIGNNWGWFRTREIYKFAEPDPYSTDPQPQKPIATYRYQFPDAPFDAESILVRGERLYIIRKSAPGASTVFRLTPHEEGPMSLTAVQELSSNHLTAAHLSPDGRYLAVTSPSLLTYYPVNDDLTLRSNEKVKYVRYPFAGDIEACCFDGNDVIVAGENGRIYRLPQQIIQTQDPFRKRKP